MTLTLLVLLLVFCLVLWSRLNGVSAEVRRLRERLEWLERQAPARRAAAEQAPGQPGAPAPPRAEAREAAEAAARRELLGQGLLVPQPPLPAGPSSASSPSTLPSPPSPLSPGAWPEDQSPGPGDPAPARAPLPSRTVFAGLGAAVTLGGAAWFTAALARSGVLTREVLLGLAAGLALALYAGAGRAAPVIGEALRGLGYGILALCIGALVGAGVAPGAVFAAILALSLAVGLHGAAQGRLLGTLTALAGASAATWIMADNLGDPLFAQLALLGILGATALAERRLSAGSGVSRAPGDVTPGTGAAQLALLPGVSLLGLVVTAAVHGQTGHPLLWAALLLAAVGAALAPGLRAQEKTGPRLPPRPVLAAAGILLAGLAGSPPLLVPLEGGLGGGRDPAEGLSTLALLLVGAVCAGGAAALHRRSVAAGEERRLGLLRDALLGVGVGTLGGALALGVDGPRLSTRLLGLATGAALLGGWLRSQVWRRLGAAGVAALLLDHLLRPWPSSVLVAGLGLGAGAALGGRVGAGVAGVAGAALAASVTVLPAAGAGWPVLDLRFGLAWLAALALHGGALGLARAGQLPRARTLGWAAVAAGVLLVALALLLAGSPTQAAVHALLAGALLGWGPGGRQAGEMLRGGPRRLLVALELLGAASAVLGLLAWGLGEGAAGLTFAGLGLALAVLAALLARVPGQSRWPWRAWPALGLAALASAGAMLGGPGTAGEGALTLLGACAALAALGGLTTPAGLRRLPPAASLRQRRVTAQAVRRTGDPLWRDALLPALGLTLLALMGRTAELLWRGPDARLPLAPTLTSTAVGLAASVALLVLARRAGRPLRWWTALLAFGLAAGKLVFVDLDGLGGMARGAATVLIGLLLLGIGQLAPRPETQHPQAPRPQDEAEGQEGGAA
ncbi:hypothetical protein [Deinococcus budaensis]|uniref:Uncharacterized protein n=1 Tax=Deinococcus budaensis TaxID=1665626 RepID=A0A7W8GDV5_9DEIO|nr:hypothetical protein [Deinococcus budaensis]MBB5233668.1 hypothetical protein [Deinococcus budaensis]